jgi:hypothetical protein
MPKFDQDTNDVTPRRGFFGRIAAMAALGLSGFAATSAHASRMASIGLES